MLKELDLSTLQKELAQDGEVSALDETSAADWGVRGSLPGLLVAPAAPEGAAAALARCDRAGAAVIPWGGGTQQRLGLAPRQANVVLATRGLNRVLEYEPGDLTVTAQAGIRLADLQEALGKNNQWLPVDPPVKPGATLGGLIATNISGPRRLKDGGFRDLVIGTRVANVDGTVSRAGGRVVKNVSGYDLNKVHIGALGTLGVLVELSLKIAPRPETEGSWVGVFPSAQAAGKAAERLLLTALTPSALDLLNSRAAQGLGLKVPAGRWALVGRASGFGPIVKRHMAEFEAAARQDGAVDSWALGDDEGRSFWAAYGEMAARLRWDTGPLTCRVSLPRAAAGPLCDRFAQIVGQPAIWGHGTGTVFWSEEGPETGFARRLAVARDLAGAAGGSLVVENWPASLAGIDVWGVPGGPISIMRAIKEQFDPRNTLNPGRYVGSI